MEDQKLQKWTDKVRMKKKEVDAYYGSEVPEKVKEDFGSVIDYFDQRKMTE